MTKLAFLASISLNWDWLVAHWNTLNALDPATWYVIWKAIVLLMAALMWLLG